MPRKPVSQIQAAKLSVDQMRKGVSRLERVIQEIEAFDATTLTKRWGAEQWPFRQQSRARWNRFLGITLPSVDATRMRLFLTAAL